MTATISSTVGGSAGDRRAFFGGARPAWWPGIVAGDGRRRPTTDEQAWLPPLESGQVAACSNRAGPNAGRSSPGAGELGCCRLAARLRKPRNQRSSSAISAVSLRLQTGGERSDE